MACERLADDLRSCAAGAEPTSDLRVHLEGCADCRARLEREQRVLAGIDRVLADALRVEPSLGFNARVESRIAAASAARSWPTGWHLAIGTAALVIVAAVTVTVVVFQTNAPPGTAQPPVASRPGSLPFIAPAGQPDRAIGQASAAIDHRAPRRRTRTTRTHEPEVLVPPGQQAAVNRFIGMIVAGKLHVPPEPDPPAVSALTVEPIVVEEVKVPPVNVPAAAGTPEKRDDW